MNDKLDMRRLSPHNQISHKFHVRQLVEFVPRKVRRYRQSAAPTR